LRVVALDLGTKRIGIATGNTERGLASPHSVMARTGSVGNDHQRIKTLVVDEEAERVVVGLPVDLRGEKSIAAQNVLAEVAQLTTVVGVPVETYDERMTTAVAHKSLAALGVSSRKRRDQIDKYAAAEILQGWFDAHNTRAPQDEA
jgi:putative holliday junction resolvase